ncbi:tagaturonate reductase [Mucilaginibacter pocheonensis]|uniref:Tagaturonate reductase n=1 Tax=Mucilaginibacter pocheonensis TaxID=398050 RepID=A0ABU1TF39_9SPHI|nr:tagaturonate reductase [Mucilaginibacter pocheonensis]MDR6944019.1 tagaturonate reductase [Mucilaginibacter pocheonensis]
MILSKYNLKKINAPALELPGEQIFDLPEKVLQFGTGVLLRGLPDYFIDKANRNKIFNGRVVVVKSTDTGSVTDFDKQDGLYTIYSKGIENGTEVNEQVICSAISRVLSASTEWAAILEVARDPNLQVVISNTTEVGIKLVKEDVRKHPPVSFPGKLLAVLYERYKAFNGSADTGLVIIPTELIVDNGKKLEAIVLELAHLNKLEPEFLDWLESSNSFCNSLVDRIVPGRPDKTLSDELEAKNGYTDNLSIMAETYSLWAIEGDEKIASVLSFAQADKGVVITPDIELFRELKLRLLNGTHTLSCAVAYLSGFKTVKDAMDDEQFTKFITRLMLDEIMPAIPYQIDEAVATDFANKVLDRFRNPNIRHEWLSISMQYSTKIKMRVIPLLLNHYKQSNSVPECMALGFAAFMRFMQIKGGTQGQYTGTANNVVYKVTDTQAEYFSRVWENADINMVIQNVLKNKDLWDADLSVLPGFKDAVIEQFNRINANGQLELNAI